jgi:hypothetical protein
MGVAAVAQKQVDVTDHASTPPRVVINCVCGCRQGRLTRLAIIHDKSAL